jgi:DNA repair protein RecN (Recombination protein N)
MLSELAVTNLVIVEQARLAPGAGLTVVSGETGAGKSLLLDALEMVLGGRCQSQMVGRWGESASVTAVIHVDATRAALVEALCAVAPEQGQYLLRRRIGANGRSQAWLNDTPVTAAMLRQVAGLLVEVHAQHESLRLAEIAEQLRLLDAFGGCAADAEAYRQVHARVLELERTLAGLDGGERESLRELDYLQFQCREIEDFAPVRGEFSQLEERHALLSTAGAWRETAVQGLGQLSDDDGAVAIVLGRLARRLAEAPDADLREAGQACASALETVRDAASRCSAVAERLHADPRELARCEERINRYHELFRKHGEGDEALFSAWERLASRIQELATLGERRQSAATALAAARDERARRGAGLAEARARAGRRLAEQVHGNLAELGMPKAVLSLSAAEAQEPSALGTHRQELLIATNPGVPAGPLGSIASGGETARISLALTEALSSGSPVPVLVFDEVDSGVGGRLGSVIGVKLARLARDRTVLAVTHTPQLAAAAHRQYVVNKSQNDSQTQVTVTEVAGDARLKEISEMLGGGRAALDQARTLMAGARR